MNTGYVLSHNKKTTLMISLESGLTLPFPDLDKMGAQNGKLIPLYDFSENI
jgi:hypothetical protein